MKIRMLFSVAVTAALLAGCAGNNAPATAGVQGYMPDNAVIAHRGTIFWAPELTEAAFPLGTQHRCRLPGARCAPVKRQRAGNNA